MYGGAQPYRFPSKTRIILDIAIFCIGCYNRSLKRQLPIALIAIACASNQYSTKLWATYPLIV